MPWHKTLPTTRVFIPAGQIVKACFIVVIFLVFILPFTILTVLNLLTQINH